MLVTGFFGRRAGWLPSVGSPQTELCHVVTLRFNRLVTVLSLGPSAVREKACAGDPQPSCFDPESMIQSLSAAGEASSGTAKAVQPQRTGTQSNVRSVICSPVFVAVRNEARKASLFRCDGEASAAGSPLRLERATKSPCTRRAEAARGNREKRATTEAGGAGNPLRSGRKDERRGSEGSGSAISAAARRR